MGTLTFGQFDHLVAIAARVSAAAWTEDRPALEDAWSEFILAVGDMAEIPEDVLKVALMETFEAARP